MKERSDLPPYRLAAKPPSTEDSFHSFACIPFLNKTASPPLYASPLIIASILLQTSAGPMLKHSDILSSQDLVHKSSVAYHAIYHTI